MAGKLFIVPTPVGNLDDMTFRGLKVLREVDGILAEDTRTTGKLLSHFDIRTPLSSFHKFNEHEITRRIIEKIEGGQNLALVSDAGTPGISDPGFLLTRECRKNNIKVETLPGATAFVPALVNSGLPCNRFFFEGFLPQKKGRTTRLQFLKELSCSFILYESPLRLIRTLEELAAACGGDREASVSREISKMYETVVNGTLDEIYNFFKNNGVKGEIVIIVAGKDNKEEKHQHVNKYKLNID